MPISLPRAPLSRGPTRHRWAGSAGRGSTDPPRFSATVACTRARAGAVGGPAAPVVITEPRPTQLRVAAAAVPAFRQPARRRCGAAKRRGRLRPAPPDGSGRRTDLEAVVVVDDAQLVELGGRRELLGALALKALHEQDRLDRVHALRRRTPGIRKAPRCSRWDIGRLCAHSMRDGMSGIDCLFS
jgi:hypothetical protein